MTQYHKENVDYGDWSDIELTEELLHVENVIEQCQASMAASRKTMNRNMDSREKLLDIIRQRSQSRGWRK